MLKKLNTLLGKRIGGLIMSSLLLAGVTGMASAQNRISTAQVMNSLAKSGTTARKVGIDVDAVRRDILARIKAEGGTDAASPPPVADILRKLPVFIVQIQFDLGSDVIRPASWETVGRIADALHHPLLLGNRFLVVGHTDSTGSRESNLKLSERRAAAVTELLTSTFRVPRNRLLPVGFGEEQIFDTSNPKGGVNRRVEFINLGPT
ncbi:MAG: OmpA family protein [Rhizobiaceae bacterium]